MRFKYVLEVIKHSLTLKSVREQLAEPIKKLTDNEEEYNFIMERLPKFYVDYYNHPIEHIEVWDKEGNVHMNDGTETSVNHPSTMRNKEEYLLSIHNHLNKISEMQSNGDYSLQVEYNTKYGISIGFHGVVLTKNGYPFDPEISFDKKDIVYYHGDTALNRRFIDIKKTNPECVKAREDWLDDKIMGEEMDRRIANALIKELDKMDINELINEQNAVFNKENNIPLTSTYIPIKKIYE